MPLLQDKIELEVELAELKAKQTLDAYPKPLRWLLIVSVLAIIPAYLIAKGLSYNYWAKSYSQFLITAKPSFTEAKAPEKSAVSLAISGSGTYSAAIKITNPNLDLALPKAPYEFIFSNAKGEQIFAESGETFLLPGESKYIVVPRFTSNDLPAGAAFNFSSELHWVKRASLPKVPVTVNQPNTYNQYVPAAFVAEGSYQNESKYLIARLRLNFLIFDRGGKIVGASRRDDFTIQPGEQRSYKQIWPNMFADPDYKVKVFAEVNPFSPGNLTSPPSNASDSADLSRPKTDPNSP